MTIPSGNDRRNDYTGDNTTATYSYDFRIDAKEDLLVVTVEDGTESELTVTTDYTVSGVGNANGGTITLTAGNLGTDIGLTILGKRDLEQGTDLRGANNNYSPGALEGRLDKLAMQDIQQQDELDRSLHLPVTEIGTAAKTTLPDLDTRKSKFMAFNASGEPIASAGTTDGSVPVSAFMETVLDDTTAADARTTLGAAPSTLAAANVPDELIANAKLAHVATKTIKGRTSASTGDVEDLTREQFLVMMADYGFPQWQIDGHSIANNATDADHDIDFGAMVMMDATHQKVIVTTALTKQIDAVFAEGDNAGMLDTGTVAASTVYALWSIMKPDGTADYLASTSFTSPTMPSGFSYKRRTGWLATDAMSNIVQFTSQYGYIHPDDYQPVNDSSITSGAYENSGAVAPPYANVKLIVDFTNATNTAGSRASIVIRRGGDTTNGRVVEVNPHTDASIYGLKGYVSVQLASDGSFDYMGIEDGGSTSVSVLVRTVEDLALSWGE